MSAATRPQFACPVAWCAGDIEEHGGDGAAPDEWLHQSEVMPLSGELWAQRWQSGTSADRWQVNSGRYGTLGEGDTAEALAVQLEQAARELREAACGP